MNLLSKAFGSIGSILSHRILALCLVALGALIPQVASAQEGENVKLAFSKGDQTYLIISLVLGVIALAYGWILSQGVLKHSPGSEKMQSVGLAIKDGAMAYLSQQIRTMLIFVVLLAIGLFFFYQRLGTMAAAVVSFTFICGVAASYIAGFAGMVMAVNGNMRTANAALTSYKTALEVAFRSGAVAGMVTVGMGLIGATLILWFGGERSMIYLVGFGFGGSLAALFMRVGGGIFTKAADVGADLVGKVEAGIPEDDPRNPATIADNVGDNVGDCAGMAADIFESYEVTLVAAIILGAATAAIFDQSTWMRLILFALMARGVGIIASIIGIHFVKGTEDLDADPLSRIRSGFYTSAVIAALGTGVLAWWMMGGMPSKNPVVVTHSIESVAKVQQEDYARIAGVAADVAKQKNVPVYKVEKKDILADQRMKDMGLKDTDEMFLTQALGTSEGRLPRVADVSGYRLVTAEELGPNSKNPVANYAIRANQMTGGNFDATKPYQTVGSFFGGAGKKRYIVAQVRELVNIPAQPAQGGMPARPAEKRDNTSWIGPMQEEFFDKRVDEIKKQPQQQGVDVKIEVLKKEPVTLYANAAGDLAMGVPSTVDRPYLMEQGQAWSLFAYNKISAEEMNKLAQPSGAGQMPQLPPAEQPKMVSVNENTVPWWAFWVAIAFGIVMAFAIEMLTDYYVSTHKRPVQEVAGVATAGPAPMIIQGFAYAAESSVFMVFAIVIGLLVPLYLFNPAVYGTYILSFYGIALVGLGLLTTTGYVLAMDTFGPISDNAQGVYEMSGEGHNNVNGSKAVQRLDAAGNTTKALTKGFAITTAVVAAVALFHSYIEGAMLAGRGLPLDIPEIFLGLLVGGAAPFLFTAFSINAVGRASFQLINEVRRQFREDPGIMAGTSKPDYARCVAIVTAAAQKELLSPGILAIALPIAVGFGFSIGKAPVTIGDHQYNLVGAQALGGFLAGAILSGQLMAVLLANSGGMWDNAKKLIEDGLHGGKGTEAHKAGVVCDTVGDPFKDTAGPALNPLIKVMNLVALLLAPAIIMPLPNSTLTIITVIALAALSFSIYMSKKGSMSTALVDAQKLGKSGDDHFSHPVASGAVNELPAEDPTPSAPPKRKLLVEDDVTPEDEA
ncbi:MAG TPA: sodium/proton-translocating pyrophosphatase [Fimbriimonas sp.]|nr:sodium/proton-translocating pyrophosphatase [Fimbriimonas sp.]